MADRKYKLAPGAQQTLAAVIETVPPLVEGWKEQIESGEIDEQLRNVCVSFGWITQRDSRVTSVQARPARGPVAVADPVTPLRARSSTKPTAEVKPEVEVPELEQAAGPGETLL